MRGTPDGTAATSALFVDLYELTMAQAYIESDRAERPATFSLFARRLPPGWGYLVAAGTEEALAALAGLRFSEEDLGALEATGSLSARLLDRLRTWRFRGRVRALAEGTPFGPGTPVLEVDAPLIDAQLVETLVLNAVHAQSLVAAKASRCVEAARGRLLVDFSMRRDHGPSAAMAAARASHIAGFDATSNVLAAVRHGIPCAGTMAHSFVEAFPDEAAAFAAFARAFPDRPILLVDTYDTPAGVRRAAAAAARLRAAGHRLGGVRLDSGDLGALAAEARAVLDAAGETEATRPPSGRSTRGRCRRARATRSRRCGATPRTCCAGATACPRAADPRAGDIRPAGSRDTASAPAAGPAGAARAVPTARPAPGRLGGPGRGPGR